jgi:hypothetical protein
MEYEKGEWFGELALMGDAKRSATIKAVTSVKCLQLPRSTFEAFMGKCEDIVKRDKEKYDQVNAALKAASGAPETPRSQSARQAGRIDGSMDFLAELQRLPGGMHCADCGDDKPTWGSSNTGALICLNCSGVHRLIGAHNSKMLSVKLDAWEPELVENMKEGNEAVNGRLEKLLKPEDKPKPGIKREALEDFIYSKYVAKNFSEGGNGEVEVFPERKDEKRSESNIGMIVMSESQAHASTIPFSFHSLARFTRFDAICSTRRLLVPHRSWCSIHHRNIGDWRGRRCGRGPDRCVQRTRTSQALRGWPQCLSRTCEQRPALSNACLPLLLGVLLM